MIAIDLLKNHQEAIPRLVQIWLATLGSGWMSNVSASEIENWLQEWLNDDILPFALIAFDENKPVGMCSLQMNDGIHPDLFPWLGDLCVDVNYQNQGIGKQLVRAAQEKIHSMGFEKLYLFIFEESLLTYYQKQGWKKIGQDMYEGHPVIVMECTL